MGSRTHKQERKRSFKKHRATGDVAPLNHPSAQASHPHDKDSALQHLSAILGEFTLILDANGTIRGAWICNAKLAGQFHSKLIGQGIVDLVGGSYYPILEATCFRVLATGQREYSEYVVEHSAQTR